MTFFFNAPIGKPSPYFSYETESERLGYKNMIVTTLMMFFIALLIWGCAAIVTYGIPDTELVVIIIKAFGKLYFALGALTFALIAVPIGIIAAPWLRLQCELCGMNFRERSYVTCKPNTKREICLTIDISGLSVTVASIIGKDEHTKYNYSSQTIDTFYHSKRHMDERTCQPTAYHQRLSRDRTYQYSGSDRAFCTVHLSET